jgi:hypothetical protein
MSLNKDIDKMNYDYMTEEEEVMYEPGKLYMKEEIEIMVNHPPHYTQGDIECIDAMRAQTTDEEFRGHCKMCAAKYIWRERHKGGDEAIKKAIWYLEQIVK